MHEVILKYAIFFKNAQRVNRDIPRRFKLLSLSKLNMFFYSLRRLKSVLFSISKLLKVYINSLL